MSKDIKVNHNTKIVPIRHNSGLGGKYLEAVKKMQRKGLVNDKNNKKQDKEIKIEPLKKVSKKHNDLIEPTKPSEVTPVAILAGTPKKIHVPPDVMHKLPKTMNFNKLNYSSVATYSI